MSGASLLLYRSSPSFNSFSSRSKMLSCLMPSSIFSLLYRAMSEIMVRASLAAASGLLINFMSALFPGYLLDEDVPALFSVGAHKPFDKGRVPLHEGLYYLPVLPYGVAHAARQRKGRYPEPLELLDELVDQGAKLLVAAGLEECVMELVVELEKAFDIALIGAPFHLGVKALELLYVFGSEFHAGRFGRVPLQEALYLVELAYILVGYGAYDSALPGRDSDEALGLELPERLPYGGPRYAERFGYLLLRDSLP